MTIMIMLAACWLQHNHAHSASKTRNKYNGPEKVRSYQIKTHAWFWSFSATELVQKLR